MCRIPEFIRSGLEIIKFGYLLLSLKSDKKSNVFHEKLGEAIIDYSLIFYRHMSFYNYRRDDHELTR